MIEYEVVEVDALPPFNPSRTVKNALFAAPYVSSINVALHKSARFVTAGYFVGASMFLVVLLSPPAVGRVLGIVEALLETPSYLIAFLALRVDLVALLLQSYDYWFVSVATVIFTISFSVLLGDLRAVLIVSRWLGFQLPILTDAGFNRSRTTFYGVIINMLLASVLVIAVSLDFVKGASNATVSLSSYRSISARDTLLNAIATMQVLLLRIAIRKHKLAFKPATRVAVAPSTVIVTCVTIRSFLRLQAVASTTTDIFPQLPKADAKEPNPSVVQLRLTPSNARYDSSQVVLPPMLRAIGTARLTVFVRFAGLVGLLGTSSSCILRQEALLLSIVGAIGTAIFVGLCCCCYNRSLLSQLLQSFDYVFLSLQITAAHVCLSDMLFWRLDTTITLVSSWLWIHWVITLDSLLPCAKASLGIRSHWWSAAVVALYLCGEIVVVINCVHSDRWPTQNRVLAKLSLFGRKIEFHVLSFFVSRLVTLGVWTARLLWRICHRPDPSKLIMLRGQVEFEYTPVRRESGTT